MVFDEVYYVKAARAFAQNKPDVNWVHPPLGKALIAASMAYFGDTPWAWRLPGALASVATAGFFYLLCAALFQSRRIAVTASLLYLLDGITFVQSRLATLDIFMVGFLMPAFYFFLRRNYSGSGIFLGLAASCKWVSLFAFPFFFMFEWLEHGGKKAAASTFKVLLPVVLIYLTILRLFTAPVATSASTFSLKKEVKLECSMFVRQWNALDFHVRPGMNHPYAAPWWKWILLIRPIWYAYDEYGKKIAGIVVLPNPFLWWPALPAFFALLWHAKEKQGKFILLGLFWFILPWAAVKHGGFMYYLLPASPFLILSLVYWIGKHRWAQLAVLAISLAGFILFYPLYSYTLIPKSWFYKLMWLPTWI